MTEKLKACIDEQMRRSMTTFDKPSSLPVETSATPYKHNCVRRSYRDLKATAYEAARCGKARCRDEIIEIVDMETRVKIVMLEDGRTA